MRRATGEALAIGAVACVDELWFLGDFVADLSAVPASHGRSARRRRGCTEGAVNANRQLAH